MRLERELQKIEQRRAGFLRTLGVRRPYPNPDTILSNPSGQISILCFIGVCVKDFLSWYCWWQKKIVNQPQRGSYAAFYNKMAAVAVMKKLRRLNETAAFVRRNNLSRIPAVRMLALFLIVVAGFDIVSTNAVLAAGHFEGNPVVNFLQAHIGTWWSAPKMIFHLMLALFILWLPSRKMIFMARAVVGGFLVIVFNNFYFAGWVV